MPDSPLYVHPIPETSWAIVLTSNANHFYFNTSSKLRVWQITDIPDFSPEELAEKIDFNEVAILIGQINGVHLPHKEEKKPQSPPSPIHQEPESEPESEPEPLEHMQEEAGASSSENEAPGGIAVGYSSEEENESESAAEEPEDDVVDLNAGLDLSLGDEETEENDEILAFKQLLSNNRTKFSIYDPWVLVEEELMPVLVEEGGFYGMSEETKEKAYNEWVAEHGNEPHSEKPDYPTPAVQFFHQILEEKPSIRKLPYVQFKKQFPQLCEVAETEDQEGLYRKLRTVLNDFAKYEKETKKRDPERKGNLKVQKVQGFLSEKLPDLVVSEDYQEPEDEDFFTKWIHFCIHHNLPKSVVEDPVNFIVGDEKRCRCYQGH